MCMTLQALVVFLNLIGPELVDSTPGKFVIHAENGDVTWVDQGNRWCTLGPQLDRMARF